MATLSEVRVCGRWLFGIAGSNLGGGGAWMPVSSECCFLPGRGVCASGGSLVQKSPTESGVSECDRETVIIRGTWPNRGRCTMEIGTSRILNHF